MNNFQKSILAQLDHGLDVNYKDEDGNTVLLLTVRTGDIDMAHLLLNRGADPNLADSNGNTPLFFASRYGRTSIAELLLNHGSAVNPCNVDGMNALMIAAQYGQTETVSKLMDYDVDVNAINFGGDTALSLATKNNHSVVIALLKSAGAKDIPSQSISSIRSETREVNNDASSEPLIYSSDDAALAQAIPVEVEIDDQPQLPYTDLADPNPVETFVISNMRYRVPSFLSKWLDRIDWDQYEQEVVQGLHTAAITYRERAEKDGLPPIFQMAVCTSEKLRRSSIDFETRENALLMSKERLRFFQEIGVEPSTQDLDLEYNPDESSFLYFGFASIDHPSLMLLERLSNDMDLHFKAARSRIEVSLLKAVDRLVAEGLLAELPCEEVVWIGTTSILYLYDHVRRFAALPNDERESYNF